MKGYTYVLRCADDTLYCGWTNDLTARLAAHNSGKGAKYTRGRGPVTLVYSEMFDTQSEAMQREAAIKKLTRPQKQALIDSQNGGELLTVYDADGRACGERPRAVVHAQGLSHHVCHLWVVGERNGVCGLWLQQRQFDRPLFPGGFDLTSTGHIDPGETPLIEKAAFMSIELDDLQAKLEKDGWTSEYQNGQNQWGTKKSPEAETYIALSKNYAAVIKQLTELVPAAKRKTSRLAALREE